MPGILFSMVRTLLAGIGDNDASDKAADIPHDVLASTRFSPNPSHPPSNMKHTLHAFLTLTWILVLCGKIERE